MLMHGQAYPTIFYALDYHSVSIFHRQSRYSARNLENFDLIFHILGLTQTILFYRFIGVAVKNVKKNYYFLLN